MPSSIEAPTISDSESHGTRETHPAYGQISVSRASVMGSEGGAILYGSDFSHPNVVVLRIAESTLSRDLNRDWHFAGNTIIEVAMSEAQWATFVSSFNVGSGVPCTIERREGVGLVPGLPAPKRTALFTVEANEDLAEIKAELEALREKLEAGTSGLSAKKTTELTGHVHRAQRMVNDSIPFVEKQLARHMETTVEAAKAEVHGYIAHQIGRAGLTALGATPEAVLQLETDDAAEGEANG